MSKAYSTLYSSQEKMHRNKFFIRADRQKIRCKNCSGIPGVISYQDNFNAKGNILFVVPFDFETTTPTFNFSDPEQLLFTQN